MRSSGSAVSSSGLAARVAHPGGWGPSAVMDRYCSEMFVEVAGQSLLRLLGSFLQAEATASGWVGAGLGLLRRQAKLTMR